MTEYSYELKIPNERVAVLIGKEGEVKKSIEGETNSKINIDSKEGDVFVSGEDALGLYTAREVIKSIGRGFNPDVAKLLLRQDYVFEVVNLLDYVKSKDSMIRLKGRVIGRDGKTRKLIEQLTESYICVYGKTIGIIGEPEPASAAKQAIESLLKGSTHANVYKYLEKRRREIKKKNIMEM
jgi:ribosomal RNA assembly protein